MLDQTLLKLPVTETVVMITEVTSPTLKQREKQQLKPTKLDKSLGGTSKSPFHRRDQFPPMITRKMERVLLSSKFLKLRWQKDRNGLKRKMKDTEREREKRK